VFTAIGSGSVIIIDGKKIEYNNIADIDFGKPISVENIIVHIMSKGDEYNVETRNFSGRHIEVIDED
jgi:cyanophycinase